MKRTPTRRTAIKISTPNDIDCASAQIDDLHRLVFFITAKLRLAEADMQHYKNDAQYWRNRAANPVPSLN